MKVNGLSKDFYAHLALILMSALTTKVLLMMHVNNLDVLQLSAQGVLSGKPSYSAFQNRLLGPFLTDLFMKAGYSYRESWLIFNNIGLIAFNFYLYSALRRMKIPLETALLWVCSALFLFLSIQHFWFYPWDTLELLIFTIFVEGILANRSLIFFIAIFVVGIFNRESALFIALYLMIRNTHFHPWRVELTNPKEFVSALFLLIAGILWTIFIRDYLFISRPDGGADFEADIYGSQFKLIINLKDAINMNYGMDVLIILFSLIAYIYYFFSKYNDLTWPIRNCLLIMVCMLINTITFGVAGETRIYIPFIPFVFLMVLFYQKTR